MTSTVEAGIRDPRELRAYQRLRGAGRLPVRTYLMMMLDETLDDLVALGIQTGFGDDVAADRPGQTLQRRLDRRAHGADARALRRASRTTSVSG